MVCQNAWKLWKKYNIAFLCIAYKGIPKKYVIFISKHKTLTCFYPCSRSIGSERDFALLLYLVFRNVARYFCHDRICSDYILRVCILVLLQIFWYSCYYNQLTYLHSAYYNGVPPSMYICRLSYLIASMTLHNLWKYTKNTKEDNRSLAWMQLTHKGLFWAIVRGKW